MGEVKTIKGVDADSWSFFKSIAAKNNMKMGKLFENMVEAYKEKSSNAWDKILNPGYKISEKEAAYMKKAIRKIRKDIGFRA
ncbi:hypothetical protein HYU07_00810 [Candidatus Woesearchaeota archaeon]|nr:hypothetical protein [Candidatus Woesearchaeota archaeon]